MRALSSLVLLGIVVGGPAIARADTPNGNDFALFYSEAKDEATRKSLLEEALGKPHAFRYLQVMELDEGSADGATGVRITAFEPASCLDVKFTVTKAVSLSVLRAEPVTKRGDAIAVTGKVAGVDGKSNAILLESCIVKHKDRLNPKMGKELLGEVDPSAVFYSYTAGPRPVNLSYRDRDLLQHKERILAEKGPAGWVEFLEQEVAKRRSPQPK